MLGVRAIRLLQEWGCCRRCMLIFMGERSDLLYSDMTVIDDTLKSAALKIKVNVDSLTCDSDREIIMIRLCCINHICDSYYQDVESDIVMNQWRLCISYNVYLLPSRKTLLGIDRLTNYEPEFLFITFILDRLYCFFI